MVEGRVIDLHTHSNASDGTDPPATVVRLAALGGLSAVALTDHDTTAGLPAARDAAAALSIRLVSGCEIACATSAGAVHVLCYFVDSGTQELTSALGELVAHRARRNHQLAELLAKLGLPVTYESALAQATSEQTLGRPHFARALVSAGAVDSVPQAFELWLGVGRPAFVEKAGIAPERATEAARSGGGVCVLAHPLAYGLAAGELDALVGELAAVGFVGIEANYASYDREQRSGLDALALAHGLVATGGSDYHGEMKPDLKVGTGRGDLCVPDEVLERLAERAP
ncbi:MAG: PHP domain-containing protein [Acidimicrobiales bacterium]